MMTQEERRQRRERIAKWAADNGVADASRKFGVSTGIVYESCAEFGLTAMRINRNGQGKKQFQILKRLIDGMNGQEIADQFGVTRQWVNQVKIAAKEAGFDL